MENKRISKKQIIIKESDFVHHFKTALGNEFALEYFANYFYLDLMTSPKISDPSKYIEELKNLLLLIQSNEYQY